MTRITGTGIQMTRIKALGRSGAVAGLLLVTLGAAPAPAPAAAPAKGKQSYGKAFTVTAAATPIEEVLSNAAKFDGKPVKVTGKVTQVCQAMGCWFEVAQSDKARGARIKSADHSIFVPKDSAGKTAVVEGTFAVTTLSEAQARHMAEDGAAPGAKPAEVKGPVQEFQVVATAVEFN